MITCGKWRTSLSSLKRGRRVKTILSANTIQSERICSYWRFNDVFCYVKCICLLLPCSGRRDPGLRRAAAAAVSPGDGSIALRFWAAAGSSACSCPVSSSSVAYRPPPVYTLFVLGSRTSVAYFIFKCVKDLFC